MKHREKTPADINQLAKFVADQAVCEPFIGDAVVKEKNAAAVALGLLGSIEAWQGTGRDLVSQRTQGSCQEGC